MEQATEPATTKTRRWKRFKISHHFKFQLSDLIDPFQIQWADLRWLEVWSWMVRGTYKFGHDRTVINAVLDGNIGVINTRRPASVQGLDWNRRLARRFQYALCYQTTDDVIARWRHDNQLYPGLQITIPGPTVAGDRSTENVRRLLGASGWLAWSLNDCHPKADAIHYVSLIFDEDGCTAVLTYGYPHDSSSWCRDLAEQRPGEPLASVLDRAVVELERLKDPNAEPPVIQEWAAHGGKPAAKAMDAKSSDYWLDPERDLFWWRYTLHPIEEAL